MYCGTKPTTAKWVDIKQHIIAIEDTTCASLTLIVSCCTDRKVKRAGSLYLNNIGELLTTNGKTAQAEVLCTLELKCDMAKENHPKDPPIQLHPDKRTAI